MFLITWVFDKLGYMPKFFIDANWPILLKKKADMDSQTIINTAIV